MGCLKVSVRHSCVTGERGLFMTIGLRFRREGLERAKHRNGNGVFGRDSGKSSRHCDNKGCPTGGKYRIPRETPRAQVSVHRQRGAD